MANEPCLCGCGHVPVTPGARYCYTHHWKMAKNKRKPSPPKPPKTCEQCGVIFHVKWRNAWDQTRFCSRTCSGKAHTAKRSVQRNCAFCDKDMSVPLFRVKANRGTYCSKACYSNACTQAEKPGCYRINAFKSFERKCHDCGYDVHPEIILVHHIDGNRRNGKLNNLVLVCPNCHTLRHLRLQGSIRLPTVRPARKSTVPRKGKHDVSL